MSAEIVARTRRTSLVSTFGVGGLLPAQDDSVMIRGLDDWPKGDLVTEPRLARSLGVRSSAARRRGAALVETCRPSDFPSGRSAPSAAGSGRSGRSLTVAPSCAGCATT